MIMAIWHIRQCKHCPKNEGGKCPHKQMLKENTAGLPKIHVTHNCTEYPKLFKRGQRVRIETHNRVFVEDEGYEWESAGFVTGVILGFLYKKKFFAVRLDEMIKRDREEQSTARTKESVFQTYIKPANKIELLPGKLVEPRKAKGGDDMDDPRDW